MIIGSISLLTEVPSSTQHIKSLNSFANYDMPSEFVLSMLPNRDSEYWKVKHIQSLLFWYRVAERDYMSFKLGDLELLDYLQGLDRDIKHINRLSPVVG